MSRLVPLQPTIIDGGLPGPDAAVPMASAAVSSFRISELRLAFKASTTASSASAVTVRLAPSPRVPPPGDGLAVEDLAYRARGISRRSPKASLTTISAPSSAPWSCSLALSSSMP